MRKFEMQTFLPYSDFKQSAKCLDYKRLGKQRVECFQIYKSITDKNYGWKNHPAVKMWIGYESALIEYYNEILKEWINRGYKNNMKFMFPGITIYPHWLGGKIHTTHRSALLVKNYDYYSRFGWKEIPEINYFWPQ